MAILTRSQDVEGDLNCTVGSLDFSITDAEPQYHTDDPDVVEFGERSDQIEVAAEEPAVEQAIPIVEPSAQVTEPAPENSTPDRSFS